VPSPKAKDLFDQLQQKTDPLAQLFRSRIATPTRKELLSILFFAEYDLRLGPDIPTNPRMTAAEKATRMADIFDVMVPALLLRRNARAADALLGAVPPAAGAPSSLIDVTKRLSTAQLNLFREFFPDGVGGINLDDFRLGFEQFANGELRKGPAFPGAREPEGGFFFLFAEFAFLCIDSKIDDADWKRLLRVFVQTQEIFMHIYRPAPHPAPPRVGAPTKCLVDALGNPVPRRPLDGLSGFDKSNFNAVGQSNAARKAALRAKYARMDEAALRKTARDNLLRAQCMP